MEETQITIKLSKEQKDLIKKASNIIGLGHSSFCKSLALEKSIKILTTYNKTINETPTYQ